MRKLGFKNIRLFFFMTILAFLIMGIFFYGIRYVSKIDTTTYDIAEGSIVYNDDFQLIETRDHTKLKRSYDSNYYLTTIEEGLPTKYKIGQSTIVYHKADYKMYLYGVFYQVMNTGEVKKIEKKEEVTRTNSPFFYKISDRKYLWVDKRFTSEDGSIKTKDYLIIELDKQGNATLANNEMNEKTINPIILKGSQYDFDIAHEKLIIGKQEINLKNIIGSSNLYKDPDKTNSDEKEENEDNSNGEGNTNNGGNSSNNGNGNNNQGGNNTGDLNQNYYDEYLKTLVDHFNTLTNNIIDNVENNKNENKPDTIIDLTRWVSLGTIESGVTSIKLNYNVFDPNNEYSTIFITVDTIGEETKKIYLSKENNSYSIRGLQPNKEYTITFGYQLSPSIDPGSMEISDDVVKVKTNKPNYELKFSKITTEQIYFYLKMDTEYQAESGSVTLYSDDVLIQSIPIDIEKAKSGYTASFPYKDLGQIVEIRVENLVFNGHSINLDLSSKYINQ